MGKVMTDEKVRLATQLYASGGMSVTAIAKQIGVSQSVLSNWINKQPWYEPKVFSDKTQSWVLKKSKRYTESPFDHNKDVPENTFVIPGNLPSLNEYISALNHSKYLGNSLKKSTEEYICSCITAGLGYHYKTFECAVQLTVRFYEKDHRRDWDNVTSATKYILDALKKGGVIYNDGQKYVLPTVCECFVDPDHPRVEVQITPHPERKLNKSDITPRAIHKKQSLRYMSDGEIVREYNASADKKEQIKILAQLNSMSVNEVKHILISEGVLKEGKK